MAPNTRSTFATEPLASTSIPLGRVAPTVKPRPRSQLRTAVTDALVGP